MAVRFLPSNVVDLRGGCLEQPERPPPPAPLQNVVSRMATTWARCYEQRSAPCIGESGPSPPLLLHLLLPLPFFAVCLFRLFSASWERVSRVASFALSRKVSYLAGCLCLTAFRQSTQTELIWDQRSRLILPFFCNGGARSQLTCSCRHLQLLLPYLSRLLLETPSPLPF